MRVRWDAARERVLAGGLDCQLKLFALERDPLTKNALLKVAYKVKLPQEVTSLDVAGDGMHFALGMSTGTLLIKSRRAAEAGEEDEEAGMTEEQKLIKSAMVSSFVSKAKNYKYFYRGQYSAILPEEGDVKSALKQRKQKLQPFELALKQFQYRQALS